MAKPKTKRSVFDTTVTETSPGSNVWRWKTQSFEWELDLGRRGLNFSMVAGEKTTLVAFFEKADAAVAYSWGFAYGFNERGKMDGDRSAPTT
jgi:hypothetical protein